MRAEARREETKQGSRVQLLNQDTAAVQSATAAVQSATADDGEQVDKSANDPCPVQRVLHYVAVLCVLRCD